MPCSRTCAARSAAPIRDGGVTVSSRILLIGDDAATLGMVKALLREDGHKVQMARDGARALRLARAGKPDLIVVDLMLPFADGLETCRRLRQESNVPIVMLTSRTTGAKRLMGLDIGVDGYITRPFDPADLAAWVRAVLARLPHESGPSELRRGDVTIDLRRHEAFRRGRPLPLTRAEFRMLSLLATMPGTACSRDQLAREALRRTKGHCDRTVDAHIHNLRRKIEPDPANPSYIRTVYGIGYVFSQQADATP